VYVLSYEDLSRFKDALLPLGLTEYEAVALGYLMLFGEAKATAVASSSKIPTPRIYETLSHLAKLGLVRIKPGRPVLYSAVNPKQAIEALISNKRQELETMTKHAETFIARAQALSKKRKPASAHSPLLRIIDIGEISENETRRLYEKSKKEIFVLAKVAKYMTGLSDALVRANQRGVKVRVLMASPETLSAYEKTIQQEVISELKARAGRMIDAKFSHKVPLRGTIIDPSSPTAEALFLAEEADVAPMFREAAITSNTGLVSALASFFNLLWKEAESI
jgi:sugar-specific transcriptional regulator TrmB